MPVDKVEYDRLGSRSGFYKTETHNRKEGRGKQQSSSSGIKHVSKLLKLETLARERERQREREKKEK